MNKNFGVLVTLIGSLLVGSGLCVGVEYDKSIPQLEFGAGHLREALQVTGAESVKISIDIELDRNKSESFTISRPAKDSIRIISSDAAGAMYGCLEVAEELRIGGVDAVTPDVQEPYLGMRGIKFNIPLDVRTPGYSDMGDAGQYAIEDVWDFEFWREYIDEAASHRYNYISLWNLHPFPSLVKVPEYPGVALDDVKRAVGLEKKFYHGRGVDYDATEILDETETLLHISIDDKIEYWRKVMRYGKERNVDFYFVTWNIFDYGTEQQYEIDEDINNPITADYFRQSVKQLFLTYPDLKGIGITAGEHMPNVSAQEKEDWAWKAYGLGVLDVLKVQPERKVTFLHRQHEAGAIAIADTFQPLINEPNFDFIFSYKYAKAHSYSSEKQPFYQEFANEIQGRGDLKTIWTMRNDSTYLVRWAAPAFMREYVQNIPMDLTRGYYFGSDGWVWGREFIRKGTSGKQQLELKKHWFQWLLWGRLAYDSNISDERFVGIVQSRFPTVDAAKLMDAWQAASMTFPLVTGFHWGPLDYHWYPEACVGFPPYTQTTTGFHDVNRFITLPTHPGNGYASIPKYVEVIMSGKPFTGTGPNEVSAQLLGNADSALAVLEELDAGNDLELKETLADIKIMAMLSRYYGHKITGATSLHLYRETGVAEHQARAVASLESAAEAWRAYTENLLGRYHNNIWMSRVRIGGTVDFNQITEWVEQDVEIAKTSKLTEDANSKVKK